METPLSRGKVNARPWRVRRGPAAIGFRRPFSSRRGDDQASDDGTQIAGFSSGKALAGQPVPERPPNALIDKEMCWVGGRMRTKPGDAHPGSREPGYELPLPDT